MEQLVLITTDATSSWRLDPETIARGRRGVREARARLVAARRPDVPARRPDAAARRRAA